MIFRNKRITKNNIITILKEHEDQQKQIQDLVNKIDALERIITPKNNKPQANTLITHSINSTHTRPKIPTAPSNAQQILIADIPMSDDNMDCTNNTTVENSEEHSPLSTFWTTDGKPKHKRIKTPDDDDTTNHVSEMRR